MSQQGAEFVATRGTAGSSAPPSRSLRLRSEWQGERGAGRALEL